MNTRLRAIGSAMLAIAFLTGFIADGPAVADPVQRWSWEWPKTDFTKHAVEFSEIISGGPPKDGIPSIDNPIFRQIAAMTSRDLTPAEPVIGLVVNGEARAYPLRILVWHEIVNDEIAGIPVTVTYCPLCNSAIVFDRRLDGRVLDFGTTGKLRNSDMVMYDRQTESWWQQFLGEGIVGEMTGKQLKMLPARLESFEKFRDRAPNGKVLVPNDPGMRAYGDNPYVAYDSASASFLFNGDLPGYIAPMVRVVVVEGKAWSMPMLRGKGTHRDGDLLFTWSAGQNSALDADTVHQGRDVGNITVQRAGADVVYDVTFAFVYHVFHGGRRIVTE
jgi:hypothetical protein